MKAIRWLACVFALGTLATMGLLGLRLAAPVAAGATLVVDDDGYGSASDCDSADVAYGTIQAAIAAAAGDDTILVCPGTYTEAGQIVISANLSIVGAGASTTIIKPAGDTGSSGDARGWFLVNDGITFNLSGVTLDGTGRNVYQGIRHKGAGTISDCALSNIKYPGYMGVGMAVMGPSGMNVDVTNCTFTEMGRIGVIYFGAGVTGTFSGNTYTGKGDGDWLDYAVEVGGGANATITDNTISGNTGVASSDGSTSAGILVTTYYGSGTQATITGNTISGCTEGIAVGYDASDTSAVTANSNNLAGNVTGINSTAPAVDAEDNWWGSADGPTHASNTFNVGSQGVAASDNVDFVPWLDAAPPGGASFAPVTTTDPVGDHASIQAGIDFSNPGGTVNAADGTYTATSLNSIVITKNGLSLVGESRDGTIIDAGSWGTSSAGWPRGIQVYANDVTIRDLTVQGFTGDTVNTGGYGIVFRDWAHDTPAEGYIFYTGGLVDNVKLDNNSSSLYALVHRNLTVSDSLIQNSLADGMFIARESDDATITGNTVLNSANHGIWVGYCWSGLGPSDNATITGNVVDGAVEGGISFVASSGAVISGNDVSHVKGEEPEGAFGGWSRGAISLKDGVSNVTVSDNVVHDNDGLGTGSGRGIGVDGTSSNITVTGNTIRDNAGGGIKVMGTTSGWTANSNSIYGNTGYGAQNVTGAMLDFTDNWWNSASGPTHASNKFNVGSQGEAVSDNVDFVPWLDAAPPTGNSFAPVTTTDPVGEHASIQAGVDFSNPGGTVNAAVGTFTEQPDIGKSLTLTGAGQGSTIIKSLSVLATKFIISGKNYKPVVYIHDATDVTVQQLTVDGDGKGNGNAVLKGIAFYNAGGAVDHVTIIGVRETPLSGAQNADGLYAYNTDGAPRTLSVTNNTINDYQKNAMGLSGAGLTVTVTDNTTTCSGPTTVIAQNGIQVGAGASGTIQGNDVSGCIYTGPSSGNDFYNGWQGTGILTYDASGPVTVSGNTVTDNDMGIYSRLSSGAATIQDNTVQDNLYFGIVFRRGDVTATGNTVSGSEVGILIPSTRPASSSAPAAHLNDIAGNTVYGVRNDAAYQTDATDNWWGSANGPTHASNTFNVGAQGVPVTNGAVFVPWLDAAPPTGVSFAPVTTTDPVGSYASIQAGVNASNAGGTVNAKAGTYSETLKLDNTKAGDLSVIGASAATTFINGGIRFEGNYDGLTVEDFTITGDGRQRPGLSQATVGDSSSLVMVTNARFANNVFDGENVTDRFGLYLDRLSGSFAFEGNEVKNYEGWGTLDLNQTYNPVASYAFNDNNVHDNKGSTALRGSSSDRTDTVTATGNVFDNNGGGDSWASLEVNEAETVTVSDNSITNTQVGSWGEGEALQFWHITSLTVTGNTIENNYQGIYFPGDVWSSDLSGVEIHSNSISGNTQFGFKAEAGNTGTADAEDNWWGSASGPTHVSNTFNVGAQGDVVSDSVDFVPWLDGPPSTGNSFAPVTTTDPVGSYASIQAGIDASNPGGTVNAKAGTFTETLNVSGRSDISTVGADRDTVILKPAATLCWDVGGYGCARRAAIRVVSSTDIDFSSMTFDFDLVKGNNIIGVFYWDSTGVLDNNVLKNMMLPDASGGYYEITSYIRAPSYSDGARAAVTFSNNVFLETGRLGIVTHDFVQATIEGNIFTKTTDDFGYAMEIGSRSTATVSDNTISGYDTPAASDGSASAGIYIENAFTSGLPHIQKPVTVTGNTLTGNQYGLWIGNEYDTYAGDIDVIVTLSDNIIQDNTDGGVYVVDEDRADGSSVTLTASGNTLADNGHAGYYFNTYGDGELHADVSNETISGHENGILVEDNASGTGSSLYDLAIGPDNDVFDNDTGVFLAGVSGVVISGNEIHHNLNRSGYAGVGILLWGDNDDNQILDNVVHDNDRQGIFVGHDTLISTGNVISGNTIYNNGLNTNPNPPDASAYGLQLWNADSSTITNNEIYGHDNWEPYAGFDFAQGIYLFDSNDNLLSGNYLHNNNYGIGIWGPGRGDGSNLINFNNISANTGYGARSFDAVTVNAEDNWWGSCTGPYHPTLNPTGTGNRVSDNVDFEPWVHGACDTDADGLTDDEETLLVGTDWQNADTDGDGCKDGQEYLNMPGFSPLVWYDVYDVPVSANPDPTPNGPRDQAVTMGDVIAVLSYVGAYDGGPKSPRGMDYDSIKGSCDWNADTTPDKEGLCYDRSPSSLPDPPWEAGPPSGAVNMQDVLVALAQVGLSCMGPP
jgi:parallel beta-helix repeat protein